MFVNYNKWSVYVVSTLIILTIIFTNSKAEEKEYIYYNRCQDSNDTLTEWILCNLYSGVVMGVNATSSEINVVTFKLPPIDPVTIFFDHNYCIFPEGAVSRKLFYSFSNDRPSAANNDGILDTSIKSVIKRPSILEPSTLYIGIEGEHEFNTICFRIGIGPASWQTQSYGDRYHASKEGIFIRGEISGNETKILTIYNPERQPISAQLFQVTFTNITIGGFYSFTKQDLDTDNYDGVLSTNNETKITWPSSRQANAETLYIAVRNIKDIEGNSTFLIFVKTVQESPGFWGKWFGWLG